jgi:predicted deacetylase
VNGSKTIRPDALSRAMLLERAVVVSIHDVAPATHERVRRILRDLEARGVSICSLLVVPNYHRSGESMADRQFAEWLCELQSRGHEIVIHGYFHERARRRRESLRDRLITRLYTADEGEFFDIGYDEALRLIRRAREEFENEGLRPIGFIAPAWLLSMEAEAAARDAGIRYTTRIATVRDFDADKDFHSRSMVYSTRAAWRRAASIVWNTMLFRRLTNTPLVRLGIHPPDRDHEGVWSAILRHAENLAASRSVRTYQNWLANQTPTALAGR